MSLTKIQLFEELSDSSNVLLAGAGGGFDIYSGVPLYFALRAMGKNVHLANLSFASLRDDDNLVAPSCFRVTRDTAGSDTYFPERVLSRWLYQELKEEVPIYAMPQTGVMPLRKAYQSLAEILSLDAIVLVDGGTDSLMRGDEFGLGTPGEDIASIAAVHSIDVPTKLLSCIGFGIDHFHGVCHAQFLEAVAALAQQDAFLGTFSLKPQDIEAEKYLSLVEFASENTPARPSIVNTSIASSVAGHYGDYHATDRTIGSKLWINPLMGIYWTFELNAVYERNLYVESLQKTESFFDVNEVIRRFRESISAKPFEQIPH